MTASKAYVLSAFHIQNCHRMCAIKVLYTPSFLRTMRKAFELLSADGSMLSSSEETGTGAHRPVDTSVRNGLM